MGIPSLSISDNLHPPLDFGPAIFGQSSILSSKPSPSESGQGAPFKPALFGHGSVKSEMPSPSESGHPPIEFNPGMFGH